MAYDIEVLKEAKCQEPGCYNYREHGYIYCITHLHGSPSKMLPEYIQALKEVGI